ncbi:diguanylate cyclase (GGDEF)-like protein [Nakamurella sp. UYEF19]|uniref:sensor domain-containing diguanylate cyclase n=1 Tax=Nakamurella sp. UYEF19 TaxID=1756392 RepID=UPI0033928E65
MSVEELTWAVSELAAMFNDHFEVDDLLRRLCEVAATSLPDHGVGVMRIDTDAATRFVHASDPPLTGLEQLQEQRQEGPSRDAIDTGQVVVAATIAQMRWPVFQQVARTVGVQAVLAMPLISQGHTWGTLDLYWRTEHEPTDQDRAAAQLLANVAVAFLSMAKDRAETLAAHQLMAHRALHDQLTGLPNREVVEEHINHALAAAGRRGALVAVLFIDVDHFKTINDTYGHRTGDELLQILARRMENAVRAGDTVGRLSGDEFLVVCKDIPDGQHAPTMLTRLGQRIRSAIAQPITPATTDPPVTLTVTVSIGVAITTDRATAATLIHTADVAMYRAKGTPDTGIVMLDAPTTEFS